MQDPYADSDVYDNPDLIASQEPLYSPIDHSTSWTTGDSEVERNQSSHHGLEALSAAATANSFAYTPFQDNAERTAIQLPSPRTLTPSIATGPSSSHSPLNAFPSTSSIGTPRSRSDIISPIDPNLEISYPSYTTPHTQTKSLQLPKVNVLDDAENEHEIAFLLRHYAESTGYACVSHISSQRMKLTL